MNLRWIFLAAAFLFHGPVGAAEEMAKAPCAAAEGCEFEVMKITPAQLRCEYTEGDKKPQTRKVAIQDCWMEAKEVTSKTKYKIYLEPAQCQGKKGDKIQLNLVKHVCKETTAKLKCVRMGDKKTFLVDRLIDQSFETKICNAGEKEAWLEKSWANRSEVKY